jgi:acylphosphatase
VGVICRRFLVSGRVQGVFYRASTAREAERLGLQGWAKNLPDGRVEVLTRGTPDAVAELAAWLRRGPPAATVTAVDEYSDDLSAANGLDGFRTC